LQGTRCCCPVVPRYMYLFLFPPLLPAIMGNPRAKYHVKRTTIIIKTIIIKTICREDKTRAESTNISHRLRMAACPRTLTTALKPHLNRWHMSQGSQGLVLMGLWASSG
jgi:hypothetical protein